MATSPIRPPIRPPIRLGVDIGGTFTDVVLEAGATLTSVKVLTTHAAPEDAILDGIAQDNRSGSAAESIPDQESLILENIVRLERAVTRLESTLERSAK